MLKKNDEKIDGFLFPIAFPFLVYFLSYDRLGTSLCTLHRLNKTYN